MSNLDVINNSNDLDTKLNTSDALKKIEITKDFVKHVSDLDDNKKQQIIAAADNAKRLIYENKQLAKSSAQYQNNRRMKTNEAKKQVDAVVDGKFDIVDGKFDVANEQQLKTAEIVRSVTDQLNNYLVKKEVVVRQIETPYIDNTARLELRNKNEELLRKSRLLENKNVTLEREASSLNARLLIQTNEVDRLQRDLNQKTSEYHNLELLYNGLNISETALKQKLSNIATVLGININADLTAAVRNIISAKERLEIDKSNLQIEINRLIAEINNLRSELFILQQQLSAEKKDVADKTIEIEEMKKEIIKKEAEIKKKHRRSCYCNRVVKENITF